MLQDTSDPQSAEEIITTPPLVPPTAGHSRPPPSWPAGDVRKFINKLVNLKKADGKPYLPATYYRVKQWEDFSSLPRGFLLGAVTCCSLFNV